MTALRKLPPILRTTAIAEALAVAADSERPELATELLELALVTEPDPARLSGPSGRVRRWISALGAKRRRLVSDAAMVAVSRHYSRLGEDAKLMALTIGAGRWRPLLQIAPRGRPAPEREAVAELCAATGDLSCAEVLVLLINDDDERVAAAADDALVRLAERAAGLAPLAASPVEGQDLSIRRLIERADAPKVTRETRRGFETLLAGVIAGFGSEHRRRGAFLAAALLVSARDLRHPESAGPLAHWLTDDAHPGQMAFRAVLRRSSGGVLRGKAWEWLAIDRMARTCMERLQTARDADEHEPVLRRAHLVLNPARARRVRMIPVQPGARDTGAWRSDAPIPSPEQARALTPRARLGLVRWVDALALTPAQRQRALGMLLSDADPAVRWASSARLEGAELVDYCFDHDPRVAGSAVVRWAEDAPSRYQRADRPSRIAVRRSLQALTRSASARVREVAARALTATSPWEAGSPESRLCARRWAVQDRAGFVVALRSKLREGADEARVGAIMLARALRLTDDVVDELIGCAGGRISGDERVQATAVAALETTPGPLALEAALACLNNRDGRVRANATETIGRLVLRTPAHDPRAALAADRLIELKDDQHHRVRVSALRSMLRGTRTDTFGPPDALRELTRMLGDERGEHRLSGVWLAERAIQSNRAGDAATALVARITDLAGADTDQRVRARARRCAHRAQGLVRSGWSLRAASVDQNDREML